MTDPARILPFVALAEQPHRTGVLGCAACGYLWAGVWLTATPVQSLECPACHVIGQAVFDPPRAVPPALRSWSVEELADHAARGWPPAVPV